MGYFVQQKPKPGVALMHQWIQHDNLWLRRVAILHQVGSTTCRLGSTLLQYHVMITAFNITRMRRQASTRKAMHAGPKL